MESLDNITETIEQALPVPVRMDADERYTGRGVTIAFLDSGFYAHKDLIEPANRILAYHNIFAPDDGVAALLRNRFMMVYTRLPLNC